MPRELRLLDLVKDKWIVVNHKGNHELTNIKMKEPLIIGKRKQVFV